MRNIDRVREFHTKFACFNNDERRIDNFDRRLFTCRINLIKEEAAELMEAVINNDRLGILDALTDLDYVIDGTYLTFGMEYKTDADLDAVLDDSLKTVLDNVGHGLSYTLLLDTILAALADIYLTAVDGNEYSEGMLDEIYNVMHSLSYIMNAAFEYFDLQDVREAAAIEVHASNMSKLGEDGKPVYRESDGKVLKGPNYFKPNLGQFIDDGRRNSRTG